MLDKLRAYRPVLTMPYNGHAGFHIGLWSPYLERTGQPFTVVTTDALAFQRVAERYTMPVIYAPKGDFGQSERCCQRQSGPRSTSTAATTTIS